MVVRAGNRLDSVQQINSLFNNMHYNIHRTTYYNTTEIQRVDRRKETFAQREQGWAISFFLDLECQDLHKEKLWR